MDTCSSAGGASSSLLFLLSPTEQQQRSFSVENEEIHLYRTVNWFISVDIKQPGNSELDNCPSQVGMVWSLSN